MDPTQQRHGWVGFPLVPANEPLDLDLEYGVWAPLEVSMCPCSNGCATCIDTVR